MRARALDAEQALALSAAAGYHGGLLFEDGGQIDPLALARGLAERCRRRGVVLLERCPAKLLELKSRDGMHVIRTPRGDCAPAACCWPATPTAATASPPSPAAACR